MSREILFRGKRIDDEYGLWAEGLLSAEDEITQWDNYGWDVYQIDPATVGQYSGRTDRDGTRIFEGDIVNGLFLYAMPIKGVCAFHEGAFGLEWDRAGYKEFTPFTSTCNVDYVVLGNIHDNPGLMEGE